MTPQHQTRAQDTTPGLTGMPAAEAVDLATERASHAAELTAKDAEIARLKARVSEFSTGHTCHQCRGLLAPIADGDIRCAECDETYADQEAEISRLKARERDA